MAVFGDFVEITFENGNTPAINETNLNAIEDVCAKADEELRRSASVDWKTYLEYYFDRSVLEIEAFEDDSDWTSGTGSPTLSNDPTYAKTGSDTLKLLEPDASSGDLKAYKSVSLDLTKFNNGIDTAGADAVLGFLVYASDKAKVNSYTFRFGDDASNNYYYTQAEAGTGAGYNYMFTPKSDFSTQGSPTGWDSISWIQVEWNSTASATNEYVCFDIAQLMREHSSYWWLPDVFVIDDGNGNWDISQIDSMAARYWMYFDKRIGKIALLLYPDAYAFGLHLYCTIKSFVSKFEFYVAEEDYLPRVLWYYNGSNYIGVYIENGTFYITANEAGTPTDTYVALSDTLYKETKVKLYFEKNDDKVRAIYTFENQQPLILEYETSITSEGCLYIGSKTDGSDYGIITDFQVSHNSALKSHDDDWRFPRLIKKRATEYLNSSTTMQNDDDLFCYLPPNGIYKIELYLAILGENDAGIKLDWELTGTATEKATRKCFGPAADEADRDNLSVRLNQSYVATDVEYGITSDGVCHLREDLLIETRYGGGKIQLRWAQANSDVDDTIVSVSSYMIVTKVSA